MPLMETTGAGAERAMREAATFTLGRSGDRRAAAPLIKALADRLDSVRVLACLGLAQIDDPRVGPALVATLKDGTQKDLTRAACAYAIGARKYAGGATALLAALDDNRAETQRLAAWALGQLGEPKALGPLVRAYFARAGQGADELVWAISRTSASGGTGLTPAPLADLGNYPMHAGKYFPEDAIADLPGSLPHSPTAQKLVADHATEIAAGLTEALAEHRDVVVSVLADLDAMPDHLALGALGPPSPLDAKTTTALDTIAKTIEPGVAAHLGDDDPKVRALAVSVAAKLDTKAKPADTAVGKALADPAAQVRASAMMSVAVITHRRGNAPAPLVAALVKTLGSQAWEDRRVAALALGELGAQLPAADVTALANAAGDASSFVREAVAIGLGKVGGPKATEALDRLAKDDVPQVREAAIRSLGRPLGQPSGIHH
jgi:HEAT repeat protein